MNAIAFEVPVATLAAFSGDGRVFRAFGHLLAARHGELLAVALGRSTGDLRGVVDGCPVSWEEVHTMLDTPVGVAVRVPPEVVCSEHPRLALITPYGWVKDLFRLPGSAHDVPRLMHPAGVVFSWVKS